MSTANVYSTLQASTALLSASTLAGDDVYNLKQEKVGRIQDIMLDVTSGRIRYAVMSSGGFLGMGNRLFAIPWTALTLDAPNHRLIFDVTPEKLQEAPGFDKDHWPNMADPVWASKVESYFGSGAEHPRA